MRQTEPSTTSLTRKDDSVFLSGETHGSAVAMRSNNQRKETRMHGDEMVGKVSHPSGCQQKANGEDMIGLLSKEGDVVVLRQQIRRFLL